MSSTAGDNTYLVVSVGGRRCALKIGELDEVARMVWIAPLPESPAEVSGVIDVHGQLSAVIHLGVLLGGPPTPPRLSEHLIILALDDARLALRVDEVVGLHEGDRERSPDEGAPPPFVCGHVRVDAEALPVIDMATLIDPPLRQGLIRALSQASESA